MLGYPARFRLAGAHITGSNWCPQPGRSSGRSMAGGWTMLAAAGDLAPRDGGAMGWLSRGGWAVPWPGNALDTCSGCLGRAQPPSLPSGLLPGTRSSSPVPERSPWLLRCPSSIAGTLERAGPTHEREMSSPTPCQEYLPGGCVRPWARQVLGHGRFYVGCFSGMGPQMCIQPSPAPSPPVPACSGAPSVPADLQQDLEGVWLLQEIKLLPPSLGSEGVCGGGEGTPRHI